MPAGGGGGGGDGGGGAGGGAERGTAPTRQPESEPGSSGPSTPRRKKTAPRRGITKQHKHGPPSSLDCSMRQQNYEFADAKHSRI